MVNTLQFKTFTTSLLFIFFFTCCHAQGIISTVAGDGKPGYHGDGGNVDSCELYNPLDIYIDTANNIYISDGNNLRIRKLNLATGAMTLIAGNGTTAYAGDNVAATSTGLNPYGIFADGTGNVYIADVGNNSVRKVNGATGIITTIAGNDTAGFSGDSSLAVNAKLYWPSDVCVDTAGNIYIADMNNNRIRKVNSANGNIYTIAGNGNTGYSGDGGPATNATFNAPTYICLDRNNNLYISDVNNNVIRKIDATTGNISTVAGNGTPGFSGDGSAATGAELLAPAGIYVNKTGDLYIADENNDRIRMVSGGIINTIAGGGSGSGIGDGDLSFYAILSGPSGIYASDSGAVYFADMRHNRIRYIAKPNAVTNISLQNALNIFPNPTEGLFTIQLNSLHNNCGLKIVNMLGESVYDAEISRPVTQINLTNQPEGMYFVQLLISGNIVTRKLILRKRY
jgi:sugar lactone lactonase YvrE